MSGCGVGGCVCTNSHESLLMHEFLRNDTGRCTTVGCHHDIGQHKHTTVTLSSIVSNVPVVCSMTIIVCSILLLLYLLRPNTMELTIAIAFLSFGGAILHWLIQSGNVGNAIVPFIACCYVVGIMIISFYSNKH
jgi:hypothetical protein